ncbi:hypothetical protein [Streptomyces halstedii]|uniref:hypothetical protein n=1 Tax=Streptomyces halstedii TaxID=1944 RepID=UPI0034615184
MWFFDAIGAGFQYPTDPGRLQLFRMVFGTALTARFVLSLGQGGWSRFTGGSLSLHLAEQRFGPARARLLAAVYRPVLVVRITAAAALAVGLMPRLALLLVVAAAAVELLYLKSPNAVRYTLLTGACLLLAGNLGHGLAVEHVPTANTWAQCLLVLVTADIYWNSAWQKLNSDQFRSGLYLAQWVHVYAQVKDQLPHRRFQYAVPGLVRRHAGNLSGRDVRVWRTVAALTIAAEITLPAALLVPQTMPYAVAAGIAMHVAFICLKPRQLITFSGLTVGTYVAFTP